jgi:O-antigen/teichoic acid export membrane protein
VPVIQRYFSRFMSIEPVRRQSLISFANVIGLTVLGYIATMYFAHVLGAAVLGSYYLFLAYYSVFSLIGDGGFGGAATKRISEGKDVDAYFSAFVVLRVILLAVSALVLLAVAPFLVDFAASGLLPWLLLALFIGTIAGFVFTGVYGSGKVGVVQSSDFLNTVVKIIFQILATFLGYAAAGLVGGFIAGMLAAFFINFRYLTLKLSTFTKSHLKSLFSFSFWIFLTSTGFTVFATADTILIGYFLTNADVGIYRVAYQLSTAALFTSIALNTVLFPTMSRWSSEGDYGSVSTALSRAFSFSLLLAVPVIIGGILLSRPLLYYLYGSDFSSGANTLVILLLLQLSIIFANLQTTCLSALDQPKKSFMTTSLAAGLNIVLNVALIPFLGILGAALATLLSVSLNAILARRYLGRIIPVRIEKRTVASIIVSGLVMGAGVFFFSIITGISSLLFLIGAVVLGGAVYFLLLFHLDPGIRSEAANLLRTFGVI